MLDGRIRGSISPDGKTYELRQGDTLLRTIPIVEAIGDAKLLAAIRRNGWQSPT
jgi:hypothetical protein